MTHHEEEKKMGEALSAVLKRGISISVYSFILQWESSSKKKENKGKR